MKSFEQVAKALFETAAKGYERDTGEKLTWEGLLKKHQADWVAVAKRAYQELMEVH